MQVPKERPLAEDGLYHTVRAMLRELKEKTITGSVGTDILDKSDLQLAVSTCVERGIGASPPL